MIASTKGTIRPAHYHFNVACNDSSRSMVIGCAKISVTPWPSCFRLALTLRSPMVTTASAGVLFAGSRRSSVLSVDFPHFNSMRLVWASSSRRWTKLPQPSAQPLVRLVQVAVPEVLDPHAGHPHRVAVSCTPPRRRLSASHPVHTSFSSGLPGASQRHFLISRSSDASRVVVT